MLQPLPSLAVCAEELIVFFYMAITKINALVYCGFIVASLARQIDLNKLLVLDLSHPEKILTLLEAEFVVTIHLFHYAKRKGLNGYERS